PTLDVNANLKDYKEEAEVAPVVDGANRENTTYLYSTNNHARVGCKQKNTPDCPANKFMAMTASLDTEIIGPVSADEIPYDDIQEAVHVKLYPTALATSSVVVFPSLDLGFLGKPELETPTGAQMMRMRYQKDSNGNPRELIDGYIYYKDG